MKKSTIILLWSAVTSIIYIIFYELTNNPDNPNKAFGWIGYLIFLTGLIIGTFQYRKANGGFLTFSEGYKAGLLMTLVIAVVLTVHYYIYLQVHPDLPGKLLEKVQEQIANQNIPADKLESAMKIYGIMFRPTVMIIIGFLVSILTGALLSLLSAGISTRKKPFFDAENTDLQ